MLNAKWVYDRRVHAQTASETQNRTGIHRQSPLVNTAHVEQNLLVGFC
jgi:hypothetical protein